MYGHIPENHNTIGFLSNSGADPLKNYKASKPTFNDVGHHPSASEKPFEWRFAGGPMMASF